MSSKYMNRASRDIALIKMNFVKNQDHCNITLSFQPSSQQNANKISGSKREAMRKRSEMRACKLSLYNRNTFEIKRFGNSSLKSSKSLTELHSNLMPSNILVDPVSQEKLAGQNGD